MLLLKDSKHADIAAQSLNKSNLLAKAAGAGSGGVAGAGAGGGPGGGSGGAPSSSAVPTGGGASSSSAVPGQRGEVVPFGGSTNATFQGGGGSINYVVLINMFLSVETRNSFGRVVSGEGVEGGVGWRGGGGRVEGGSWKRGRQRVPFPLFQYSRRLSGPRINGKVSAAQAADLHAASSVASSSSTVGKKVDGTGMYKNGKPMESASRRQRQWDCQWCE